MLSKLFSRRIIRVLLLVALLSVLVTMGQRRAFAQEELEAVAAETLALQLDLIWFFIASFLVFWMQAGFAMVESGFSRSKNAANLMMKNLMDFCFAAMLYFAIGYGLMYGTSAAGVIGTDNFFLSGFSASPEGALDWADFLFQLMFAGTTATIVSGAVAERLKFSAYFVYTIVMTALIYPISGHWHWGGGWIAELGFIDFAGSSVVHAVGGFAGLAAAMVLGARIGKFNKDGSSNVIPGHSLTLASLGVFILWMGWFGFNAGSTLSGNSPALAYIAVTTTMAAAAGAISSLFIYWVKSKTPSTEMAMNGALGGLVAITAGCASVTPLAAVVIGLLSGLVLVYSLELVERVLRVDDPVGAVAVHGFNGIWGTVAVGLFAAPAVGTFTDMGDAAGLFYGGGLAQLGVQTVGTLAISLWAFSTMYLLFTLLKRTMGIRVSVQEEIEGLDLSEHGTISYPEFGARVSGTTGHALKA